MHSQPIGGGFVAMVPGGRVPLGRDGGDPDTDGCLTGADDSFGLAGAGAWCLSGELPVGADLGGVTIVRLLAEGGMGRVYEARQEAPRRTVAVKVIRAGVVSSAAHDGLLAEAETLARLRHPHIAQIHTCGTAPPAFGGMPFLVMEMVHDARPITRFAAARDLSIRARVALFRAVCDAVSHGHRHGVIHRDLKPANILVDADGEPKVIDFGIARGAAVADDVATRDPGSAAAEPDGGQGAESAGPVGTLRYMSPEQVLAPFGGPDARSDVYALGLVLHELVTGRLPYDLAGKSLADAAQVLGSGAAPATAVVERSTMAEERRDDARSLAVIVATCLEPSAADRYANAGELAADLARWLEGRAIVARPPTPLESLRRLARRHRVAMAAVGGMLATLTVAVVAVSLLSWRLAGQRRAAEAAHGRARMEAAAAREQLYASTVLLAAAARDRDNLPEAGHLLDEAHASAAAAPRPIELDCLAASLDDALVALPHATEAITAVAWSPDGRTLATGDRRGVVRVCDPEAPPDAGSRTLADRESCIWSLAFSPDGGLLVAAAADGTVIAIDVASGEARRTLCAGPEAVYAVAFSPDGRSLATASKDRTARIWDVDSGREVSVLRGHQGTVYGVAFSPEGDTAVTGGHDGTVRIWDAATGRSRGTLRGHGDRVFDVAIAADGRTVASASEDGTVRLWDIAVGVETGSLRHPTRVNAVAFSESGQRLATASADGVLRIWDVARGVETSHLRGQAAGMWSLAWARGDGRLATGSADGRVRLWDSTSRPDVMQLDARALCAAYAPDGRAVAIGLEDSEIRLCDATTLQELGRLGPALGRVHGVAWSPDGGLVAGACDDGAVFVWDAATRQRLVATQAHAKRVYAVAFSPAGTLLATASEDRTVRLSDPRTGAAAGPRLVHPRRVFCAQFSPDGTRIATACEDRLARIWDSATGEEVLRLDGHDGPVNWVAYAPGGDRIASASSDGTIRLWRTSDGAVEHVLAGPAGQVWKVAFAPAGDRIAAAAADGTVHLWNAVTGRPALTLDGHVDQVWAVAFAPDGGSLVSASWDGTARMWGKTVADIVRLRAAAGR